MSILPKKQKTKNLVIALFAVIFCAIIFITRFNYVQAQHPALIAACDALFSIGVVYIIWGIILFAVRKGGLDGLFYLARNAANMFKKDGEADFSSYYDYVNSRDRGPNSSRVFVILGAGMFVVSVILFIIYRSSAR